MDLGLIVSTPIKLQSVASTQLTDCTQIFNQANSLAWNTFESIRPPFKLSGDFSEEIGHSGSE